MVSISCPDFAIQVVEAMEIYSLAYGVLFLVLIVAGFTLGRLSRSSEQVEA